MPILIERGRKGEDKVWTVGADRWFWKRENAWEK
jgi:hypothetical protein